MNFFFDRCIPVRLAHMAAVLEHGIHTVRYHDDDPRFKEDTKDPEWIRVIGEDGLNWIVISGDSKILKNPIERQALSTANLTFFVMGGKAWLNTSINEYVWRFFKVWPDIKNNAKIAIPSIFEVGGGKGLHITNLGRTKTDR
jgi:hypothetical protein